MSTIAEFRTGQCSIPVTDLDDIPACCFRCVFLLYKEFSVGDGLYYYYCGYHLQDNLTQNAPACAPASASPAASPVER